MDVDGSPAKVPVDCIFTVDGLTCTCGCSRCHGRGLPQHECSGVGQMDGSFEKTLRRISPTVAWALWLASREDVDFLQSSHPHGRYGDMCLDTDYCEASGEAVKVWTDEFVTALCEKYICDHGRAVLAPQIYTVRDSANVITRAFKQCVSRRKLIHKQQRTSTSEQSSLIPLSVPATVAKPDPTICGVCNRKQRKGVGGRKGVTLRPHDKPGHKWCLECRNKAAKAPAKATPAKAQAKAQPTSGEKAAGSPHANVGGFAAACGCGGCDGCDGGVIGNVTIDMITPSAPAPRAHKVDSEKHRRRRAQHHQGKVAAFIEAVGASKAGCKELCEELCMAHPEWFGDRKWMGVATDIAASCAKALHSARSQRGARTDSRRTHALQIAATTTGAGSSSDNLRALLLQRLAPTETTGTEQDHDDRALRRVRGRDRHQPAAVPVREAGQPSADAGRVRGRAGAARGCADGQGERGRVARTSRSARGAV